MDDKIFFAFRREMPELSEVLTLKQDTFDRDEVVQVLSLTIKQCFGAHRSLKNIESAPPHVQPMIFEMLERLAHDQHPLAGAVMDYFLMLDLWTTSQNIRDSLAEMSDGDPEKYDRYAAILTYHIDVTEMDEVIEKGGEVFHDFAYEMRRAESIIQSLQDE